MLEWVRENVKDGDPEEVCVHDPVRMGVEDGDGLLDLEPEQLPERVKVVVWRRDGVGDSDMVPESEVVGKWLSLWDRVGERVWDWNQATCLSRE